jgi:hypothetical protein
MANTPAPLRQVVAARLRQYREHSLLGLTQDHVGRAAQRLGFDWGRSSVAAIELGERDLSAAELLALPYIIDEAVRVSMPGARVSFRVSLAELLAPGRLEVLALSDVVHLRPKQVETWLGADPPGIAPRRLTDDTTGEAEQKAARRLGVDISVLASTTNNLWGRSLTAERDARLTGRDDLTPQTRGHVTRVLLDEIRDELEA